MALPINPPYPPMEASLVDTIPTGKEWQAGEAEMVSGSAGKR